LEWLRNKQQSQLIAEINSNKTEFTGLGTNLISERDKLRRNAKPFRISQKAVVIGDFQRADDKCDELAVFFITEFCKK